MRLWLGLLLILTTLVLSATGSVAATLVLTWSGNQEIDLAGYNVLRCTGVGCTPSAIYTSLPANAVRYDDTATVVGETYGYKLNAFDLSSNQSLYTATVYQLVPAAAGASDIGFDAHSSSADSENSDRVSWTHSVGAHLDRELIVCPGARSTVSVPVSSVTIGGVPLTKVRHDERSNGGYVYRTELWRLENPAIGNGLVEILWGAIVAQFGVGKATSFYNVDQTTPVDAQSGNSGSGTALSSIITTVNDDAWITDCAIAQSNTSLTVGAGQTQRSKSIVGLNFADDFFASSTVDGKAVAGAETMDWTQGAEFINWVMSVLSLKPAPPAVAPRIASLAVDATGMDLTYGATTPTEVRFSDDLGTITVAIASIPGGRYTFPAPLHPSLTFKCAFAIDAAGVENSITNDYQCKPTPAVAADTDPPVMSEPQPTTDLPAGQTSWFMSVRVDKPSSCAYATTDIPYDQMPNAMTVSNLLATALISPLSAGSVQTFYVGCSFTDSLGASHMTPTNVAITLTVPSSTADTTRPVTVTGVAADSLLQAQVRVRWTANPDGDIAGYQVYSCTGLNCSNFTLIGSPVPALLSVVSQPPNTLVSFCVRAVDTSNNLSLNCSATVTITTSQIFDVTPPSTVANLRPSVTESGISRFFWDLGTDNILIVGNVIEGCYGMGCNDFTTISSGQSAFDGVVTGLPSMQYLTVRGKFFDASGNVSDAYSSTAVTTTAPSAGTTAGVLIDGF